MVKSNRYIHGFKIELLILNPCIFLLNSMCTIIINLFRWNQIETYYMLFVLFKWNQIKIYVDFKKNYSYTWSIRDEKIHFVKCEGQKNSFYEIWGIWIGLYKLWFDNFVSKK